MIVDRVLLLPAKHHTDRLGSGIARHNGNEGAIVIG